MDRNRKAVDRDNMCGMPISPLQGPHPESQYRSCEVACSANVRSSFLATHPITILQVFYETYWDARPYQDESQWHPDGPFVWSFGDKTEYGIHGDSMRFKGPWMPTATLACLSTRSSARHRSHRASRRQISAISGRRSMNRSMAGCQSFPGGMGAM